MTRVRWGEKKLKECGGKEGRLSWRESSTGENCPTKKPRKGGRKARGKTRGSMSTVRWLSNQQVTGRQNTRKMHRLQNSKSNHKREKRVVIIHGLPGVFLR